MSNGALRLSPSGPVVINAAGGSYLPGPGSSLRLVEGTTTVGGSTSSRRPQITRPRSRSVSPSAAWSYRDPYRSGTRLERPRDGPVRRSWTSPPTAPEKSSSTWKPPSTVA